MKILVSFKMPPDNYFNKELEAEEIVLINSDGILHFKSILKTGVDETYTTVFTVNASELIYINWNYETLQEISKGLK